MDLTIKIHDCSVDGESCFAAICAEFPEANGQGETRDECLSNLRQAINEVICYRREEAQKQLLQGEKLETLAA